MIRVHSYRFSRYSSNSCYRSTWKWWKTEPSNSWFQWQVIIVKCWRISTSYRISRNCVKCRVNSESRTNHWYVSISKGA